MRGSSSILAAIAATLLFATSAAAQSIGTCPPRMGGTPHPGPYNVYFDFGKAALDPQQTAEVRKRAKQAKDIYVSPICLVGFADKVGDPAANKQLGLARARHVANILIGDGFSANNIVMDTGGEAYGRFNFGDVDRNKADRRVSIVFNR